MTTYLLVFNNAVEGREDEYNDWYTNVHLPEVTAVEGMRCAQRFTLSNTQMNKTQQWKYMALYEVDEAIGAEQAIKNMFAKAPGMNMSDALDTSNSFLTVMTSISDVIR